MATHKQLADMLQKAHKAARDHILKSSSIDRATREGLTHAGYMVEIIRGWYLLTTPSGAGTSTSWYSNYWSFVREYLEDRFGSEGYCLSPESSVDLYSGINTIPEQIVVLTKKVTNTVVQLPHETSLLLYQKQSSFPEKIASFEGINVYSLEEAIYNLQPSYFKANALAAQIALKMVQSSSNLSRFLLSTPSVAVSSRIVGAYKALGEMKTAQELLADINSIGIKIKEENPFEHSEIIFKPGQKISTPSAARVEAMWRNMRPVVLQIFPNDPEIKSDPLPIIENIYLQDAYHSLSIEGYQVTPKLIHKISRGEFDPEGSGKDKEQKNALAAKGYFGAFKSVIESVKRVLNGEDPGDVFYDDLQSWYRELFAPLVRAGLMTASDLAGYRNTQVYIKDSMHVPPRYESVLDCMETLERLLREEESSAVKAVLGHFFFGYIHPYMDGNGRIARFVMNLMLISGGFNWTVVRTERRTEYLAALELASTKHDIEAFTQFLYEEMLYWRTYKPEKGEG